MTVTLIMLIFTTALFFGSAGTPVVRKLAIRAGFIALPKADRAHTEPTALMGGLAIYGAAVAALVAITGIVILTVGNIFRLKEFAAIVAGASLMAAAGLLDDRRAMPPWLKLLAEFFPAVIVFWAGVRIRLPIVDIPFWNTAFNFALTVCWILFITNAINYMDNADGVAIMTSATTSAIFMLIALLNGQQLVSILAAAVLGASLGFARYNLPLPRTTIFMGDSGSLFLGFLLAVLGIKIRIPGNSTLVTWMVPVIVLGLPIFDTGLVFISRMRRGVSFFQGGIDHTTHRMARLGMTGLSVALAVSLINGALGLTAIFITQASIAEAYTIAASLGGIALYALWKLELSATHHFRTGKEAPLTPPAAPAPAEPAS
ncbi:MAG: undecaprenyl/decaprenyl-phosphate alpha-N-acetylglucosaminyl 1-phosphate transferase, partial [Caldilineae bacterium]